MCERACTHTYRSVQFHFIYYKVILAALQNSTAVNSCAFPHPCAAALWQPKRSIKAQKYATCTPARAQLEWCSFIRCHFEWSVLGNGHVSVRMCVCDRTLWCPLACLFVRIKDKCQLMVLNFMRGFRTTAKTAIMSIKIYATCARLCVCLCVRMCAPATLHSCICYYYYQLTGNQAMAAYRSAVVVVVVLIAVVALTRSTVALDMRHQSCFFACNLHARSFRTCPLPLDSICLLI